MSLEEIKRLKQQVEQLQRELHDEQVRRDEWEKMYNQAIAGTRVEQLQERLGQVKTSLDHEVDSRVRAELEVEQLQKELELHKELYVFSENDMGMMKALRDGARDACASLRAEIGQLRRELELKEQ